MYCKFRKTSIVFLLLAVAAVSFNCRTKTEVKGVYLDLSFSEPSLSDNLITDVRYTWKTKKGFERIKEDCYIFVHFWHRSNLIFHDNHAPEIPTSRWEPNKEYAYSRRIYIPRFIDSVDPEFRGTETLTLSAGLSFSGKGERKPLRKVFEKKLEVFPPPPDTPQIVYEDGWYDYEIDPDVFLKRWRWTGKEARCIIDNPHRDSLLFVKGGVNKQVLDNQKVIFMMNDNILDEFIPVGDYFEKSYNVKKETLGVGDKFHFIISTDKTFVPAHVIPGSKDERRLGVQVSFIYFR